MQNENSREWKETQNCCRDDDSGVGGGDPQTYETTTKTQDKMFHKEMQNDSKKTQITYKQTRNNCKTTQTHTEHKHSETAVGHKEQIRDSN